MKELLQSLARALVAERVTSLFGICGSGASLELIGALDELDVPYFDTCHEASAALMAGEYGRQTGTLGASLSIKGPGLANMLPGILANFYELRPSLSISEAYGPGESRLHKRLDQQLATSFCTKAYAGLGDPASTVAALGEIAWREAPGPVHLDLAGDGGILERPSNATSSCAGNTDFAERAARPVVIAGSLAARSDWGSRLADLRIPVLTTVAAKGVLDERLPHAAGIYTGAGKSLSPEAQILAQADLVVALGLREGELLAAPHFDCPLVEGDEAALDALAGKSWGLDVVSSAVEGVREWLTRDEWLPGALYAQLPATLGDDVRLAVDTGFFCTVAEHVWQATRPLGFIASANGRFMGTALPAAIGAAVADRENPVVCAVGDGGIRPYVAELKLALDERLPLLVLLLSDGRYGSIGSADASERALRRATVVRRPSWHAAVEGMGCPAERVSSLADFVAAVRGWDRSGPLFLEASFDPEAYAAMIEDVR